MTGGSALRPELRIDEARDPARELPSLRDWLVGEDLLRGQVRLARPELLPDQMGGLADVLEAALGHNGAVEALAAALTMWIRHRRTNVSVKVTNAATGDRVVVSANRLRSGDTESVLVQVLQRTNIGTTDSGKIESADADLEAGLEKK